MAKETERKFLVTGNGYKTLATRRHAISQGYLSRDPERTVRVRLRDRKGFITVKGKTLGCTRDEYEYEIPEADARGMLALCLPPVLEKVRWIVPFGGHTWEVDEFGGQLSPLTLAEVELQSADEPVALPPFVGQEVTGDPAYYNSNLLSSAKPGSI